MNIIGLLLVLFSILNSYYASDFKRKNYIFGLLIYLLMGYIALKNNIYGMAIFYFFVFSPIQILGFINWGKKQDENKNVIVRAFSIKNRILLIISVIIFSLILAALLNKIPNAKFTYLDSFSNIVNLAGVILMVLRFNESWWLWLVNNVIDLILWANVLNVGGDYSIYMLISSIIYLLVNVYGIFKWDGKIKSSAQNIIKISTEKEVIIIAYIANIVSLICYYIINKKIAIFVASFEILQLMLNKLFKKYPIILSSIYYLITLIMCILIKPVGIEFLIILELLLYSSIPMIKSNKYIRIIGLVNILIFIIYDLFIKLYNLVFLDVFIIIIFIYGIFINDILQKKKVEG